MGRQDKQHGKWKEVNGASTSFRRARTGASFTALNWLFSRKMHNFAEDKKYMQREFLANIDGVVTITSVGGEKINQQITITNIDSSVANINVEYSNSDFKLV